MENIIRYNAMAHKLRHFFQDKKGFLEVPAHSRVSILAACEDPDTVTTFKLGGTLFPLPQTGQMWLEVELLKNPGLPGVFCLGASHRDERNIIPGRHVRIFPMFEFEARGTMDTLRTLERELVEYLGFSTPHTIAYEDACMRYGTSFLTHTHEHAMEQEFGNAISLEYFPQRTSPFWNMKRNEQGIYNKIDVLLGGMETIGSAERSTNVDQMRHDFMHVSEGKYAQLLFSLFGQDRVMEELDEYLALPMIDRFGGGIGMMRLEAAMQKAGLFNPDFSLLPTTYTPALQVTL